MLIRKSQHVGKNLNTFSPYPFSIILSLTRKGIINIVFLIQPINKTTRFILILKTVFSCQLIVINSKFLPLITGSNCQNLSSFSEFRFTMSIKLGASSKLVGKSLFVDAKPIIQLLGGDSIVDKNLLISTNGSIKFETGALNVEGKQQKVPVLKVNGKLLYSVKYIAKLFSASTSMSKDQQILIKKTEKLFN